VPITPKVARDLCIAVKPDRVLTLPEKKLIQITKDYSKRYTQ